MIRNVVTIKKGNPSITEEAVFFSKGIGLKYGTKGPAGLYEIYCSNTHWYFREEGKVAFFGYLNIAEQNIQDWITIIPNSKLLALVL